MRVAVVSSRYPHGSAESFLGRELEMLRPLAGYVRVLTLRPPLARGTFSSAIAALWRAPHRVARALFTVLAGSGGARVLLKNLAIFPRALALAQHAHLDAIEHVHAYWLSTPATAANIIGIVNAIPWSATAHRWDIFERNMIREKLASAEFVRAISERGRAEIARAVPEHAEKISVVRLGTALTASAPLPESRREFRILCAAAFVPVKGHQILLDAFARAYERLPHLHLTLCGRGPLEPALRQQAHSLPCSDAITFRGFVSHEALLHELQAGHYDAVALASIDDGATLMEGVPSILIEAASAGIPCIATRSGAVEELLDDDCAFLAEPGSVGALTAVILDAVRNTHRFERAEAAAARARALHDPVRTASELVRLLATAQGGLR